MQNIRKVLQLKQSYHYKKAFAQKTRKNEKEEKGKKWKSNTISRRGVLKKENVA